MEVIDDWYDSITLESKLDRLVDRFEKIVVDAIDTFDKKMEQRMEERMTRMEERMERNMEERMTRMERNMEERMKRMEERMQLHIDPLDIKKIKQAVSELTVRFEKDHGHIDPLDIKKIKHALSELTMLKEREINIMIREKIPFPFLLPKPNNSPLSVRIPFSKRNVNEFDGLL